MLSASEVRVSGAGKQPQLVFACEQDDAPLVKLFADPAVIANLRELRAGVSMALVSLSDTRAGVVKKLNAGGIPVYAWMALPNAEGYYLNAGNEPQAAARFAEFQKWSAQYGLHWAAIGLDIEPNIQEFTAGFGKLAGTLAGRYFDFERVRRARRAYADLIAQMQAEGYSVQTYQFPFIADERRMHSTVLQRLAGLVDVRGNAEALMIYTSFSRGAAAAPIWKYGQDAQLIVVGVVSNQAAVPGFVPLDWRQLSDDLIVASHFSPMLGIYSLEGCVQQGFLARIRTIDWNSTVTIPAGSIAQVTRLRFFIGTVLLTLSWLPVVVIVFIAWLVWRRRRT